MDSSDNPYAPVVVEKKEPDETVWFCKSCRWQFQSWFGFSLAEVLLFISWFLYVGAWVAAILVIGGMTLAALMDFCLRIVPTWVLIAIVFYLGLAIGRYLRSRS